MRNFIRIVLVFVALCLVASCSFKHPVAEGYGKYLEKHGGNATLPKTALEADYEIDNATVNHRYEFRAMTAGVAQLWIVEFGKILEETLNAPYVQKSFGRLQKRGMRAAEKENLVKFALEKYEFKNFRPYVTMTISLEDGQKELLKKTYSSEGDSQAGHMLAAGHLMMERATLQSTQQAINRILEAFINDVNNLKQGN